MEINALIGELFLNISKNADKNSEQYKEFLGELTKIANLYEKGKNNINLINQLKSITKKLEEIDKENDKENDIEEEKKEERVTEQELGEENLDKGEILSESKQELSETTLVEQKEDVNKEEEKITFKPFDWKAYVYDVNHGGYNSRYYNNDAGRKIGGYGYQDIILKTQGYNDIDYKRDIYRETENSSDFQILLTTEKLGNVYGYLNRNGTKSSIMISVTADELATLKMSEDMELELENGKDLVNTLDRIVHSHDPYRDSEIQNQKLLVPFTDRKIEVSSIDMETAKTIYETIMFLDDNKTFNILSDGKSLDMGETIKIANIFSKIPIRFQINHYDGKDEDRGRSPAKDYLGGLVIESNEKEGTGENILTFDVKNGFTTKENIQELERLLREDWSCSRVTERVNRYKKNIHYWKYDAKRKDGLPLTDEDKEVCARKVKELEGKLKEDEKEYQKIQRFSQKIQELYKNLDQTQGKDTQSLKEMSEKALREGISTQDTDMARQQENSQTRDEVSYE